MTDTPKAMTVVDRAPIAETMHPLVSAGMAMLANNPSPETLEKLLALQEKYEANEARKAFAASLVGLKRDLPTVLAHDKTVHFESTKGIMHYTHTTLAGVMAAITEPLTKHGFSLAWVPSTGQGGITVKCRLTHAAGHFEETSVTAGADQTGGKNSVQAIGSTITYLQRYTALSLLGMTTMGQDDADDAPPAAADPDKVDAARNLRFVGWLRDQGVAREKAEEFVGRKVPDWTASDIEKMRAEAHAYEPKQETGRPIADSIVERVNACADDAAVVALWDEIKTVTLTPDALAKVKAAVASKRKSFKGAA